MGERLDSLHHKKERDSTLSDEKKSCIRFEE